MRKTIQDQNNIAKIFESFVNSCPAKAVEQLHAMPLGQALDLLCSLPAKSIILCFENMAPAKAAPFLRRIPLKQACHILAHLQTLKAAQIFAALPVPFKARLKQVLDKDLYNTLTTILAYPQDCVAAFMDQDYIAFKTDTKVRELILKLHNLPKGKFASQILIKDKNGKLAGLIKTQNIAFLDREGLCGSLMQSIDFSLKPQDSLNKALDLFSQGIYQIPVVDDKKTLLGVLNVGTFLKKQEKPLTKIPQKKEYNKNLFIFMAVLLILFLFWRVLQ